MTAEDTPSLGPHALLRKRYESQVGAWVYLEEVRNATGYKANTSADALALSLWPSRGIELHGHEIKVSRSDWLRELKDVHKSQPIQRFCDRWWLVVSDAKIVEPGELPPAWGLMAIRGGHLKALIEAPKLEREPWDPTFVAAIFRGFMKDIERRWARKERVKELEEKLTKLEDESDAAIQERIERAVEHDRKRRARDGDDYADLRAAVEDFKKVTGQEITAYSGQRIGTLVKTAEILSTLGSPRALDYISRRLTLAAENMREVMAAMAELQDDADLSAAIAANGCVCREDAVGQRCATTGKMVAFDCPVHGR